MTVKTVGIIGDGQLGMFLCEAAPALDLRTVMLTSSASSPAAQRADEAVEGAMDDPATVSSLIERCDLITYEREDVPPAAVALLREAEAAQRVRCYPTLQSVETLQDKALQKRWLASNDLATLPFHISDGSSQDMEKAVVKLGFPVVQKALRGGFDGRGVQVLKNADALANAWPGETLFEQYAGEFEEVAVLLARGIDGSMAHYGPVGMTFETDYSVLDTVSAPAAQSSAILDQAVALAEATISALGGVGVFGVEMFVLGGETVVINEISPRVHNAGHYTMEACACSQFEQHLRAISGMPLGDTSLRRPAVMRNLLCTPALEAQGRTETAGKHRDRFDANVYWYGKSPARSMRKLGHVTALGDSTEDAGNKAQASWDSIQQGEQQP